MEGKYQVDDNASSSTAKNNLEHQKDADISSISSEKVQSVTQSCTKSDVSSEYGNDLVMKRADEILERDFEKLKTESLSSSEVVRISSVDSSDPITCVSNQNSTKKPHCKFDLNQGLEVNGVCVSEPIPVVAKVGVPTGFPEKPLQFDGELGWRRSKDTSAFHPTYVENHARGKRSWGVSREFDLNVAYTTDSELLSDETPMDVSSKQPQRSLLDLNCGNENVENCHRPMNDDNQIRPTACFGGSVTKPIFDCRRSSYLVDLNPMRGLNHVQEQPPFLMAPLQSELSFVPHGYYVGKLNGLSPTTFYPPSFMSHIGNVQSGATIIPLNVFESSRGLNPNGFSNIRPSFVQNGNIALLSNGNRGVNNVEFLVPTRNGLVEERIRPVEQLMFPSSSSTKRREPDGGWDTAQTKYRQMDPWR